MASIDSLDVYILGAGASKAEMPSMPLMGDFFRVLANEAQYEHNEFWRCLTILDYLRLFRHRHPESENLAAQVWAFSRRKSYEHKRKVLEYIKVSRKRFSDTAYNENLEEVFERAYIAPSVYGQSPRHRLLAAINQLFFVLSDGRNNASFVYRDFIKKVIKKRKRKCVMISFNYDLLLDQELYNLTSWSPLSGYGFNCQSTVTVETNNSTIPNEKLNGDNLLLLKPHGSLNWRYETNLGHDRTNIFLSIDKHGRPAYDKYYSPHHSEKYWKRFQLLVTPPISAKTFSHPILYGTRQRVKEVLCEAKTVTIIGWSLPDTDKDTRDMIQRIFDDVDQRQNQLERLNIVDLDSSSAHFNKFKSLFMAKENRVYNNGFKHFIQ